MALDTIADKSVAAYGGDEAPCAFDDECCDEADFSSHSDESLSRNASDSTLGGEDDAGVYIGELEAHFERRMLSRFPQTALLSEVEKRGAIRQHLSEQEEARSRQEGRCGPVVAGPGTAPQLPPSGPLPPSHRARLVGWMREVCEALGLQMPTLFAATSILDRFVATARPVPPEGLLQLLSLACMSIAVKYEEVGCVPPRVWLGLAVEPRTQELLYQPRDLQRMEWAVLHATGWRLHAPNTLTFLQHFAMCLPSFETSGGACPRPAGAIAAAARGGGPRQLPQSSRPARSTRWLYSAAQAMALAEASLLEAACLPLRPSSLALACLVRAECLTAGPDAGAAAAAAVLCAAGLSLQQLAPELRAAEGVLERLGGARPLA